MMESMRCLVVNACLSLSGMIRHVKNSSVIGSQSSWIHLSSFARPCCLHVLVGRKTMSNGCPSMMMLAKACMQSIGQYPIKYYMVAPFSWKLVGVTKR